MIDLRGLTYYIVTSDDPVALSREVSELATQGWKPLGQLCVFVVSYSNEVKVYYAQVVERFSK